MTTSGIVALFRNFQHEKQLEQQRDYQKHQKPMDVGVSSGQQLFPNTSHTTIVSSEDLGLPTRAYKA